MKISSKIKKFIDSQGIFSVGTVDKNNLVNISPRIFFIVNDDAIYWIDFFKHKSFRNFQTNSWTTISIHNKKEFKGIQFRGIVNIITEEPKKSKFIESIIKKTLETNPSFKAKQLCKKEGNLIEFIPKICYSLNPEEHSNFCIDMDLQFKDIIK